MNGAEKLWLEYILEAYNKSFLVSPNGEELDFIEDYYKAKEIGG